jgi:hypothetical protein
MPLSELTRRSTFRLASALQRRLSPDSVLMLGRTYLAGAQRPAARIFVLVVLASPPRITAARNAVDPEFVPHFPSCTFTNRGK